MKNKYSPTFVVWEVTLNCNLNCIHCGSNAGKQRNKELNTNESIKLCKELAEIGFKGVGLMGGETLLRKDWYKISKEIKDLGMCLSIITNGYFNPEKFLPKFRKLEVESITIGFDGLKKTHNKIRGYPDAFDKTLKFIDACNEAGLDPCPITTFHKMNFNEFYQIRKLMLDRNLDWHVTAASLIGRFPKNLLLSYEEYYALGMIIAASQKEFSKEKIIAGHNFGFNSKIIPHLSLYPQWNGCYAGKKSLGIKSNGDVNGCLPLPDKLTEGNLKKDNLVKLWNDPNFCKYNRKFKKEDLGGFCKKCKYNMSCKGGCTLNSISLTGKPHNDPLCFYRIEQEIFGRDIDKKVTELKKRYKINL